MKNEKSRKYKYKTRENSNMKFKLVSQIFYVMKAMNLKNETRTENTTAIADVPICLRAYRIQG